MLSDFQYCIQLMLKNQANIKTHPKNFNDKYHDFHCMSREEEKKEKREEKARVHEKRKCMQLCTNKVIISGLPFTDNIIRSKDNASSFGNMFIPVMKS